MNTNIFKTFDKFIFYGWLNISASKSLSIIGGDSNLDEKKMIVKVLQQNQIVYQMLEIRSDWLSEGDVKQLLSIIYKKLAPFNTFSGSFNSNFHFNKQSFLSVLTVYNICNILLNYQKLNKSKIRFHLVEPLNSTEIELVTKAHTNLKTIFSEVFADHNFHECKYTQIKDEVIIDQSLLFGCISSIIAAIYCGIVHEAINLSFILSVFAITIFLFLFFSRIRAYGNSLELLVLEKIEKHKKSRFNNSLNFTLKI